MSTVIILIVLLALIATAIRSLMKNRHQCGGDCATCRGCHNSRRSL